MIKEDDGSSSDNSVPVSPTKKTSIAPPVASKPKKGNAKENSQTSSTNTTVKEVINEENTSTDSEKDSKVHTHTCMYTRCITAPQPGH